MQIEGEVQVPKSQVSVKTVITVVLTALAIAAAIFGLSHAHFAFGVTLGAALIAVALDHPVSWLHKRGMKRSLAVMLMMFALLAVFVGVLFLLIPPR